MWDVIDSLIVFIEPGSQEPRIAGQVFHITGMPAGAEQFPAGIGNAVEHGFGNVWRAEVIPAADDESRFFNGAELFRDIVIF